MNKKQKKMLVRILLAAAFLIALQFIPVKGVARLVLYLIPYIIIGYDVLWKAFLGIKNRQPFDESFLMGVATVGAFALAIYHELHGAEADYNEAIAVMLFYQIGEWFQSYAVGRSRRNITDLMDIRPDYANIEKEDGELEQVDPDEVEEGTIIVIKPGEKVPIDGIIVEGKSTLNTAALTGESLPRDVSAGSEALSGCINMTGLIKVRTTTDFEESTASKILDLVENASSRKSRSENFITKFARIYTPVVVYAALVLAVLPPVISLIMGADPRWGQWIYRALTFLVISCPCALVVSIPLSFFAGLGGASRAGVLVKGSNYMEMLSKVRTVVFDKTGTLTRGTFEVNGIHHGTMSNEDLLRYAAYVESSSTHPISLSLQKAYGKEIDRSKVTDIQEISGHGVTGKVEGHEVAAGNEKLMKKLGIEAIPCHQVGSIIHLAIDGKYAGHIVISDRLKETSKDAIKDLKKTGVRRTVMLTGDAARVADQVAKEVGIDRVRSELLPADKVSEVEKLLSEKKDKTEMLAFVGDGINDAPVLSRADVGIAMGALGSDAAIEAADVVLMNDNPRQIPLAIRIAEKCMRIVYENITLVLIIKFACLILGAVGIANMWLAVFADVGVMVIAVLNAIRALFVKGLMQEYGIKPLKNDAKQ
ncbi:MAG: heavy metal translocating P-type ATPase [Eubacterium sp.]|nr:heavy metal translocating P-type ATPase [Eubacterium sp.]